MRGEALWTIWSQSQWLGYSHVPHSKLIMIPLFDIVHGYLKFKPLPRSCNILYQGPVNCSPWPNSVNSFTGTQPCPLICISPMTAFVLWCENWAVVSERIRATKLKYYLSNPLQSKYVDLVLWDESSATFSHIFSPLSAQSFPGTLFFLLSPEKPGFPASGSVHLPLSLPETLSFMILTLWHPFTFQVSDEMLIPRSPYLTAPLLQVLSQIHSFIYGIYNLLNFLICLHTCCQSAPLE